MLVNYLNNLRRILNKIPIIQSIFNFLFRFVINLKSKILLKFGICPICGKKTIMLIESLNLRESGFCIFCSSNTRYRAMGELLKRILIIKLIKSNDLDIISLKHLLNKIQLFKYTFKNIQNKCKMENYRIYEPSSLGAVYNVLKKNKNFIFSEFFPNPNLIGGHYYKGIRFEDLQSLSFESNSIDLVITQDIFEHIKNPYSAFNEINRVLKTGGIHIFSVPIDNSKNTFHHFEDNLPFNERRLIYHIDPLRPEGAIVYNHFGKDILDILSRYNFSSCFYNFDKNSKFGIFCKVDLVISIKTQ